MIFFSRSTFSFDDADQPLTLARLTDGHHQTPAHFELRNQRIRNGWTTGSDEDRVVRGVRRPAECAVKTLYGRVVNSELSDSCLGFARQLSDPFNRIDLRCDLRQHCGLVSGAGTDLQHTAVLVELEQLGHLRDDERLRDGLVGTDWKRVIAIGTTLQSFGNKEVPRPSSHRGGHSWIVNAVMFAETRDHALARDGVLRLKIADCQLPICEYVRCQIPNARLNRKLAIGNALALLE